MNMKKSFLTLLALAAGACAAAALCGTPQGETWLGATADRWRARAGEAESLLVPKTAQKTDRAVSRLFEKAAPEASLTPFTAPSPSSAQPTEAADETALPKIVPTTIRGGMVLTNETSYELDLSALESAGTAVRLAENAPQVLIIHTHASEAYASDPTYPDYRPADTFRTSDANYSVIRVGDELTKCLEADGTSVVHDRNVYDTPSYTGSYAKSGDAVAKYLQKYPSISVVFDVHRDAIGDSDVVYKTVARAGGETCSQVMLVVGAAENGLYHPHWQENLKFALYLQQAVLDSYPTLPRPIALKKGRYNQQLANGSVILEVGSSGNTLSEALSAVRLFADAVGPALKALQDA